MDHGWVNCRSTQGLQQCALQCLWNFRNPNVRHRLLKHTTITQQGWKPASAQRACWDFQIDLAIYTSTSTCTYGHQFNSDHSSHETNSRASAPNLYWRRYVDGHRRAPCPDTALTQSCCTVQTNSITYPTIPLGQLGTQTPLCCSNGGAVLH